MATKTELADRILAVVMQLERQSQLPPSSNHVLPHMIPTGDGRSIVISDEIARDIRRYGKIVHDNGKGLAASLSSKDMNELVRRAFGMTLGTLDLGDDLDTNRKALLNGVKGFLQDALPAAQRNKSFAFGCWLVRDVPISVQIGPVRFEPRSQWLARMRAENRISVITERRLRRRWAGSRLRPRHNHADGWWERDLLESVGACPDVCTIDVRGLAANIAEKKAALAARLALAGIALLWARPSKALEGFGLLIDGGWQRCHHVSYGVGGGRWSTSGTAKMPGTTWVTADEWRPIWENNAWLLGPIGEALQAFLAPADPPQRPNVTRALFHALWWLHEACRAEAPLMATVKFAAVLDALSEGDGDGNILKLIEARLGYRAADTVTRDGRTTASLVREIYGAGRSRTLHGSNDKFGHDWSDTRELAEWLARTCLAESISWLHEHPAVDDLRQLRT